MWGGVVSEADVSRSLAAQAHMDWIDLAAKVIPPEVIKQISAGDARRFKVIPVGFGESGLIVAVSDPLDIDTIDSLSFLLQREIELVCASPEKIRQALIKYYGTADEASDVLVQQIGHDVDLGLEITGRRRHQRHRRSGRADHSHGLDASHRSAQARRERRASRAAR